MKLEKRIQQMYTFTYLTVFNFMLQSIQFEIVATMRNLKFSSYPPPPPPTKDIPNIFLHLRVDEIVEGPVPTLTGIKCGLQTLWYKRSQDRRIYSGIAVLNSKKVFNESLYIVLGNQNPDVNIV